MHTGYNMCSEWPSNETEYRELAGARSEEMPLSGLVAAAFRSLAHARYCPGAVDSIELSGARAPPDLLMLPPNLVSFDPSW